MFVWHMGKLGCCKFGKPIVNMQGFPLCKTTPSWLFFWEDVEVEREINALVALGKVKPTNTFKYVCKVILPLRKDGSHKFCGDYKLLNPLTKRDAFLMVFNQVFKNEHLCIFNNYHLQ